MPGETVALRAGLGALARGAGETLAREGAVKVGTGVAIAGVGAGAGAYLFGHGTDKAGDGLLKAGVGIGIAYLVFKAFSGSSK